MPMTKEMLATYDIASTYPPTIHSGNDNHTIKRHEQRAKIMSSNLEGYHENN